ncbi:MAG: hypothetical protein RsTaC01_0853 [Candidatus Paraimprobicoccus trichonymphae]|uniref:Uncharacterized protein n=1 Tax=Candidatus Paraimprobicoccus trichonymphae TaxID=3033793 RepID=A0AA48ICF0_9FIRM|nr:MAG: hypothetical protein RsTaC01_0853 [Candidatus Paraimprobicoccus trichonymphae]
MVDTAFLNFNIYSAIGNNISNVMSNKNSKFVLQKITPAIVWVAIGVSGLIIVACTANLVSSSKMICIAALKAKEEGLSKECSYIANFVNINLLVDIFALLFLIRKTYKLVSYLKALDEAGKATSENAPELGKLGKAEDETGKNQRNSARFLRYRLRRKLQWKR